MTASRYMRFSALVIFGFPEDNPGVEADSLDGEFT